MTLTLKSHLAGRWQAGSGNATPLVNPSTEEVVATASTTGIDFAEAVDYARNRGGPALRALTFAQRGKLLAQLAKVVADLREELITIGVQNAGNTRSDAKFDIDGASGTLLYYAELAEKLGETNVLVDGEGIGIGRSARLYGQHVLVPREGVAVHINAFNFPAWGMAEKLAVALLAGMPVITKPATATAWMTHRIVEAWVDAKVLPEGALSLVCGGVGDLLSHLRGQDVVAFTGSGDTAATIRRNENLTRHHVHVNVEADSLNSAILGPDVGDDGETLNLFLADVFKEMTQKTGQKCTAIRRIFVPTARLNDIRDRLVERLAEVRTGNPADEKTTMGPVATKQQLEDVRAGIARLADGGEIACGGPQPLQGHGAPGSKGFFISPTLLVRRQVQASDAVNQHEVFGPVATLMPYDDVPSLLSLVAAGGGGLVSSVYSDDRSQLQRLVLGLAAHHGRITIGNEKLAGQSVPPGTALPQLLHGGPGRAGGGEELGGTRGMGLYLQRVAIQGHRALLEQMLGTGGSRTGNPQP